MKCSVCENDLTGGLDTYGTIQEPLCWDCFSKGEPDHEYQKLIDEEKELKEELEDIEGKIETLEGEAGEFQFELYKVREKIGEFQKGHSRAKSFKEELPLLKISELVG